MPLVAVMVALVLLMPRAAKFDYDYRKGAPWKYPSLVSQFDFPILKSNEQIAEEIVAAQQNTIPYYKYSGELAVRNIKAAESLDLGLYEYLKPEIVSGIRELYDRLIVSDEGVRNEGGDVIFVQRDRSAAKYPASDVLRLSEAKSLLLSAIETAAGGEDVNVDSLLKSSGAYDVLATNLVYDPLATEMMKTSSDNYVSPTMGYVRAGQLIVSEGETVTAETAQVLDSYKKEYEASVGYEGPKALMWLGNILIALTLVAALFFALYFTFRGVFDDSRYLYILLVYLITAGSTLAMCKSGSGLIMMVPFTLCALLLEAFFKNKLIFSVYTASLLPLLVFSDKGVMLFTMFLVAGLVAVYSFTYFYRGWKQFITAIFTFLALAVVYGGFRLIDYTDASPVRDLVSLLVSSVLVIAGYPLIYLFERLFNLVSNSRLMELCDTGNSLLRQLEQKAPGTFQHSLQVMNMADAAARSIGANELLVRAGALYHDIGKINNPQCFVENESLIAESARGRYHSGLTALQSAHDIIRHVDDGLELARRYKVPGIVRDFILTHHGTSYTGYFYTKYLNEGGDPSAAQDFRYKGRKPWTREQTLLMLCDSVEAASRTITEGTPKAYSDFIERIVSSKMEDGQLDESKISVKELCTVKEELKTYLAQINHDRVKYPGRNTNNK